MKKNLTALLLASILLTLSGSLDTDAKAERFSLTDLSASQPEYDPGEPFLFLIQRGSFSAAKTTIYGLFPSNRKQSFFSVIKPANLPKGYYTAL